MSKNILVTGATGNLGTAVTKRLLEEGYILSATTRSSIHQAPENIRFFQTDLTSQADTNLLFDHLRDTFEKLDAVVLLTGGFEMSDILKTTDEAINKMYRLNFFTAFHAARNAYEWMSKTGGGHLIFIGARPAVEKGGSAMISYALSKASVVKLAELLNEAGQKVNVRASVVVPGIIDTPENRRNMPEASYEDWVAPEKIAETISFLLSGQAASLREVVLKVYGNS